jgi:uncharacterized membrane protein
MARVEGSPDRGRSSSPLLDILRGRRFGRPTHPIFVVFPIAFFSGAVPLDILSALGLSGAARAATMAMVLGVIGAAFAITTGTLDRAAMRPGSRIRAVATRHMLIQLSATTIFVVNLVIRLANDRPKASALWIVLDLIGTAVLIVGGDVGGQMVFKMGYRVGERPEGTDPAEPEGSAAPVTSEP